MKTRAIAALGVAVFSVALFVSAAPPKPSIEDLAFISGSWEMDGGSRRVEEHWMKPAGGAMLGMSRTVGGGNGKMIEFEFLRIVERADGIYYVAQPNGGRATDFKLSRVEGEEALFENPEHDFPTAIAYAKKKDGALTATVSGKSGKKIVFSFKPMKK